MASFARREREAQAASDAASTTSVGGTTSACRLGETDQAVASAASGAGVLVRVHLDFSALAESSSDNSRVSFASALHSYRAESA